MIDTYAYFGSAIFRALICVVTIISMLKMRQLGTRRVNWFAYAFTARKGKTGIQNQDTGSRASLWYSLQWALQGAGLIHYQILALGWMNKQMIHLFYLRGKWNFYKVDEGLMKMEALGPWILQSLPCHPSQTGRWDYKQSIVKVLIVDKRPAYTPSMHHLQAIGIFSESNKHWWCSTP